MSLFNACLLVCLVIYLPSCLSVCLLSSITFPTVINERTSNAWCVFNRWNIDRRVFTVELSFTMKTNMFNRFVVSSLIDRIVFLGRLKNARCPTEIRRTRCFDSIPSVLLFYGIPNRSLEVLNLFVMCKIYRLPQGEFEFDRSKFHESN